MSNKLTVVISGGNALQEEMVVVKTGYVCTGCGREDHVVVRPYEGVTTMKGLPETQPWAKKTKCLPDPNYKVVERSLPCGCDV